MVHLGYALSSEEHPANDLVGFGGFLMACMYGLTGVRIKSGPPELWCDHPVRMPRSWDGVHVPRLYARGRLERPEVQRVIALLAEEYGATVAVGWNTTDPRYGGGTVLVDPGGVPVAVFDPKPAQVRGEAFLLLASEFLAVADLQRSPVKDPSASLQ